MVSFFIKGKDLVGIECLRLCKTTFKFSSINFRNSRFFRGVVVGVRNSLKKVKKKYCYVVKDITFAAAKGIVLAIRSGTYVG